MKKQQTIFTAIFVLLVSILHAQSLSLSISGKTIGSQDELQVTYSLSGVSSDQQPSPDFGDWNVVGSSSSSQTAITNGHVSSNIDYTFILMPKHSGTLIVPGVSMNINGKQISCSAVKVSVSTKEHLGSANNASGQSGSISSVQQQMQQMQQQMQQQMAAMMGDADDNFAQQQSSAVVIHNGESLEDAVKGKIFIKIIPSKTTCYIGEPICVDYEVYSSVYCNATPVRFPAFGSFSVTDVNQPSGMYTTQLNGKAYRAQSIRKAQLIALKTGDLLLDSAALNCQLNYVDGADPSGPRTGNVIIKTKPLIIHVLPLPAKNKPANFSGAVGNFTISATVDKYSLPAQENNALHIQIQGTGSLSGVVLPQINFPDNVQSYDSRDSQTIDKSVFPMPVTRSFDVPFIGNAKGTAIITPVEFTYFDTQKNDYTTVSTDSIKLAFSAPVASNENPDKPIIKDEGNKKYLWIVLVVALIVAAYFLLKEKISAKKGKDKNTLVAPVKKEAENVLPAEGPAAPEVEKNDKEADLAQKKEKLKEALGDLEHETDKHQFFILAKALLIQYLHDKLDTDSADDNKLLHQLREQYPNEAASVSSLFARCNKALYMPVVSSVEHDEVLKRIKLLLHTFIYSVNL